MQQLDEKGNNNASYMYLLLINSKIILKKILNKKIHSQLYLFAQSYLIYNTRV